MLALHPRLRTEGLSDQNNLRDHREFPKLSSHKCLTDHYCADSAGRRNIRRGLRPSTTVSANELGLDHLITRTTTGGLDIVPCTEDFMGADLTLVSAVGRESMFSACLKNTKRLSEYDIVLMDNSPSISSRRPQIVCCLLVYASIRIHLRFDIERSSKKRGSTSD